MSGQNPPGQPLGEQILQLEAAKGLVLQDPKFYPDIVQGVLPIVTAPHALKELKRWGADFLAETFSSPVLNATTKQSMALSSLDSLLVLVNETEGGILKNAISCAATVYPLIFRHMYVKKSYYPICDPRHLTDNSPNICLVARTGTIPSHGER